MCSISGTIVECNSQFKSSSLTSKIIIKSCQNPVKVKIELEITGLRFSKEIDGNQDIPLPGLSVGTFGGFALYVNAKVLDNGDFQIKVSFCSFS